MNHKNRRFIYIACAFTGEMRSNNKFCSSLQNWNVKKNAPKNNTQSIGIDSDQSVHRTAGCQVRPDNAGITAHALFISWYITDAGI